MKVKFMKFRLPSFPRKRESNWLQMMNAELVNIALGLLAALLALGLAPAARAQETARLKLDHLSKLADKADERACENREEIANKITVAAKNSIDIETTDLPPWSAPNMVKTMEPPMA